MLVMIFYIKRGVILIILILETVFMICISLVYHFECKKFSELKLKIKLSDSKDTYLEKMVPKFVCKISAQALLWSWSLFKKELLIQNTENLNGYIDQKLWIKVAENFTCRYIVSSIIFDVERNI